jgi:hypothetical protein
MERRRVADSFDKNLGIRTTFPKAVGCGRSFMCDFIIFGLNIDRYKLPVKINFQTHLQLFMINLQSTLPDFFSRKSACHFSLPSAVEYRLIVACLWLGGEACRPLASTQRKSLIAESTAKASASTRPILWTPLSTLQQSAATRPLHKSRFPLNPALRSPHIRRQILLDYWAVFQVKISKRYAHERASLAEKPAPEHHAERASLTCRT